MRLDNRKALLVALSGILASALLFSESLTPSSADVSIPQHPASQGRALTPAGALVSDATTRQPAVGALTVDFVRSPDRDGADGAGRFLIAINSGYGIQFNAATNKAQQSLAVIDLNARPAPVVVQNIYFPTPQSANVGLVFSPRPAADGSHILYVSGGVENKVWMFKFNSRSQPSVTPVSPGPNTKVEAPFIDLSALSSTKPVERYNSNRTPVYPTGLAISPDGETLFVANNLDDSFAIVSNPASAKPSVLRVDLRRRENRAHNIYPYAVAALSAPGLSKTSKVYVSCWNDESVAVFSPGGDGDALSFIPVGRHPTALVFNEARTRLYVANSNADSISVIDTTLDREIERINVRLTENALDGQSPESLALSADGATLYVANAHSNSIAVVPLSPLSRGNATRAQEDERDERSEPEEGDEREAREAKETAGRAGRARLDERAGEDVSEKNESEESVSAEDESEEKESEEGESEEEEARERQDRASRSLVRGFIPTGRYPAAVAVVGRTIFYGNGKGTGFENSSLVVNNSGREPNVPNDRFPAGTGRAAGMGGEYSVALVSGNIAAVGEPDAATLASYTSQVMRNNGLLDAPRAKLFRNASPIKHVIYVIKENRTYDQVFGDLERAGNGERADGDPTLAIFGAGVAAQKTNGGAAQNITPNARALALRFGLLDRFFVNAEASPDGHNWSTAAFSSDYTDKAYRWNYSSRGRSYDYEGFNRLPDYRPAAQNARDRTPLFPRAVTAIELENFLRSHVPYLNNSRDVAEPASLYLWDAAARAGLRYRNYGEFISTFSESFVAGLNANRRRTYPDLSSTASAFPTKKSLEGNHSRTFRNFDQFTPDALTPDSYRAARESGGQLDPLITATHTDARFRGNSRLGEWLKEFQEFATERRAGRPDRLPHLSIVRLPNNHTEGLSANLPTPQFYVAENDYAVGRLVEAVSTSPYWQDTAIFVVEDDAQDGPDHVDAHRAPALVISAYNRPGALVHTFHNTVSLIRTMEILLGLSPMNQLDANAVPIDIFREQPDLRPFKAILPNVALDNLMTPPPRDAASAYWMRRTGEQNLAFADMADPRVLSEIIWFSVRGAKSPMPEISRLPAFDAMLPELEHEASGDAPHATETARAHK
ncbi:MAG TPA: bifunctional YncE family protein/alkaline phosphatase family protein [Pyrinomonadaceae bacterium]|nr:bifunctional YncE family protein/alkaline phosphatase family protein [Pyrinomonadaceae bacterium]